MIICGWLITRESMSKQRWGILMELAKMNMEAAAAAGASSSSSSLEWHQLETMSQQALYSHNLACFTILHICNTHACIQGTWLNFVLAHTFKGLIISHFSSSVSFVLHSFVSAKERIRFNAKVKKSKVTWALISRSQEQTYSVLNRSKVVVKSLELNNVYRLIGFYFLFDFMCANNRLNMLNYTENFIFSGKRFTQCANTVSHAVIQGYTACGRPYGRV